MREGSDVMAGAPARLVPVNFLGVLELGRGGRESRLSSGQRPCSSKERLGVGEGGVLICNTHPTHLSESQSAASSHFSCQRSRFSNGHFLPLQSFSLSLFLSFCFLPGRQEEAAGVEWCWWWVGGVCCGSGAPGGAPGKGRATLHVSINREGLYI